VAESPGGGRSGGHRGAAVLACLGQAAAAGLRVSVPGDEYGVWVGVQCGGGGGAVSGCGAARARWRRMRSPRTWPSLGAS